ncbi:tetratricopeptide repeat (TPR)-like superfamily protein [Wolffia australiana]
MRDNARRSALMADRRRPLSPAEGTKLMSALFERGHPHLARQVFDQIPHPDIVAWTALVNGFASSSLSEATWGAFRAMLSSSLRPNAYTLSALLKLRFAPALIHAIAVKSGLDGQIFVSNALVAAYAAVPGASALSAACDVFYGGSGRSPVSWTTIIAAHVQRGHGVAALGLFKLMLQEGVPMGPYSGSAATRAATTAGSLKSGEQIHSSAIKLGFSQELPMANSLLDMYTRCGEAAAAETFFSQMPLHDVISWNTMIAGMEKLHPARSLKLFTAMAASQNPNSFTFTSMAAAIGALCQLSHGEQLHAAALRRYYAANLPFSNAMIDLYAKCGKLSAAIMVFKGMKDRDLISWTTMITAYGSHGLAGAAMDLLEEMVVMGQPADHVALLAVISACSHAGQVDDGLRHFSVFQASEEVHGEVYGGVVDLLGRAGKMDVAMQVAERVKDVKAWRALLGVCRINGGAAAAQMAAGKIAEKGGGAVDAYAVLSGVLAAEGEWEEFAAARKMVKGKKMVGKSSVQVRDVVSAFAAGDRQHPQSEFVYQTVNSLTQIMRSTEEEEEEKTLTIIMGC